MQSFNLVIEVLFFSRSRDAVDRSPEIEFQSRNRGSFLFKIRPTISICGRFIVSIS